MHISSAVNVNVGVSETLKGRAEVHIIPRVSRHRCLGSTSTSD